MGRGRDGERLLRVRLLEVRALNVGFWLAGTGCCLPSPVLPLLDTHLRLLLPASGVRRPVRVCVCSQVEERIVRRWVPDATRD